MKTYICQFCNKTLKDKRSLIQHLKKKHFEFAEKYTYKCLNDRCSNQIETLKWNNIILREEKKYCSASCKKEAIRKTYFSSKYVCNKCSKEFKTIYQLQRHLKICKINKCNKCGKIFKSITEFKHHNTINCTETKYICQFCNKQFKNNNGLHLHLKCKHNNEIKPEIDYVKCLNDNCSNMIKIEKFADSIKYHRKFCSNKCLNEYKSKHLSRDYKCYICNQNFTSKKFLDNHINNRHLNKKYKCVYCNATYNSEGKLHQHYKEKHLDKIIIKIIKCKNPLCNNNLEIRTIDNYILDKKTFCNKHCSAVYRGIQTSKKYKMPYKRRKKLTSQNNGNCKWYDYIDKNNNKHRLQGTYELLFAKKLDELNIKFVSLPKGIKYIRNMKKTYYFPDFYIPSKKLYIDTKAQYYLDISGDKFKIFRSQHPNINLLILTQPYLRAFNIKLK